MLRLRLILLCAGVAFASCRWNYDTDLLPLHAAELDSSIKPNAGSSSISDAGGEDAATVGGTGGQDGMAGNPGAGGQSGAGAGGGTGNSGAVGTAGASNANFDFVLVGSNATAEHGGTSPDGVPYNDACPNDQVIGGYTGTTGQSIVTSVEPICVTVTITALSAGNYAVSTAPGVTLPKRGGSGTAWTQVCPSNQVVVAFQGRAGSALDQVAFGCAPLSVVNDQLVIGTVTVLPAAGGTGGSPFTDACPSGQIARGSAVKTSQLGSFVQSLGLVCGTPSLQARTAQ